MHSSRSVRVALAAAALFSAACHHDKPTNPPAASAGGGTPAKAAKIKCFGANACAGQSACDMPDGRVAPGSKGHDCAGNNECEGKGWLSLTPDGCTTAGGGPI